MEALAEQVAAQSALLADLRKQQADGPAVEEVKKKLGELKKTLAVLQHAAAGGAKGEKKKERMLLKTPKVRTPVRCGCEGLKLIEGRGCSCSLLLCARCPLVHVLVRRDDDVESPPPMKR